jgi:DNA repair exonuclease SbcCD ATPase subunit
MIIKSLHLVTFQSHVESTAYFTPGVNVITGINDNGKTSLIRGIRWIAENRPIRNVKGFVNDQYPTSVASVSIRKEDSPDDKISRPRRQEFVRQRNVSGSSNKYFYNSYELVCDFADRPKFIPLTGFGTGVPEVISSNLKLSEINIQTQLSRHFLILDPPGQIAAYIRKIAGLDDVDAVLTRVREVQTAAKSDVGKEEAKQVQLLEQLERIYEVDLEGIVGGIEELEKINSTEATLASDINSLSAVLRDIDRVKSEMAKLPDDLDTMWVDAKTLLDELIIADTCVTELEGIILAIEATEMEESMIPSDLDMMYVDMDDTANLIDASSQQIDELDGILGSLEEVLLDYNAIPCNLDAIELGMKNTHSRIVELNNQIVELADILSDVDAIKSDLKRGEPALQHEYTIRDMLMGLLKSCPYCGQDLVGETARKHLLEHG